MKLKKIESYQLEELKNNGLYINVYDLDLKYEYELNKYWKEFAFDIIEQLIKKGIKIVFDGRDYFNCPEDNLIDFFKKEYYNLIKENKLNIDINDYIEIVDYISFEDWLKNKNNGYGFFENEIYLIQK